MMEDEDDATVDAGGSHFTAFSWSTNDLFIESDSIHVSQCARQASEESKIWSVMTLGSN